MRRKPVEEFKRKAINSQWVYVCPVEGGGEVHRIREKLMTVAYDAYDSRGNYLGQTEDIEVAKYMAGTGCLTTSVLTGDHVSHLSMWVLWCLGVDSGRTVFKDKFGSQIMAISNNAFMVLTNDDNSWDMTVRTYQHLRDVWYNMDKQCFMLQIADAAEKFYPK